MPYHIKTTSDVGLSIGEVYYVNKDHWSSEFSERKIFSSKAKATAAKKEKVTKNDYTYIPTKLKTSTIVSE
jgi:hypothetical protein